MAMKITRTQTLESVLEKYPTAVSFLQDRGIVCFVCGEPTWGNMEEIVGKKGHDVDKTIDDLNTYLKLV